MVFIDLLTFIMNILGLKVLKMLVFDHNSMLQQTQFRKKGMVSLRSYLVLQGVIKLKIFLVIPLILLRIFVFLKILAENSPFEKTLF